MSDKNRAFTYKIWHSYKIKMDMLKLGLQFPLVKLMAWVKRIKLKFYQNIRDKNETKRNYDEIKISLKGQRQK